MRYNSTEEAQQDHIKNYRSDGIAKGKGTMYASDAYRVQFILDNVPKKSTVLDVGCNTGVVSVRLKSLGCHVKGIDIVQELVDKAIKNGVFAEQGTAEDLSRFNDASFDCVVCSEVLEHLYDPLPAIKEAHRVLKVGGKYVVTVPHPSSVMNEGLGDYHQHNFSWEVLDTLIHSVFLPESEEEQALTVDIPYQEQYCIRNGYEMGRPQWLGIVARKNR